MILKHEVKMGIRKYRTSTGQRTSKYRGTKICVALGEKLKSTVSLKHFINKDFKEEISNLITF